ncbi:unnamed protein product [Rotaria magnacalcarata]|uniref:Uncharacterized protein n=1 Tax=Rotaria magnacalcarata TaxID=392030 RepID=A0A820D3E7_9BILA|nr:unnamed protein product [Rotaria magnacalcarata]CAF4225388.1 unnamed protein product [Rotaria magnacalcarata]
MDDESSSFPIPKPGFQTPGTNKRLRSDSDEQNGINSQTTFRQNNTTDTNSSSQQMTSSNRIDFPPITVELTNKHDKTDRKLVEELIKEWKHKNNKNINIVGRFGFRGVLLIFARDLPTLDELLSQPQWPSKMNETEIKVKFPTRLPDSYSLVIRDFQSTWDEREITDDLQAKHMSLLKLTRLIARNSRPLNAVRADFSSSKHVKYLISIGEIELNYMKLQVRPYYSPVKINKCKKCFRHDHFTNQCTSEQLCIRMNFPSISPQLDFHAMSSYGNTALGSDQENNRPSYASVAAPRIKNNHENVEQMIMTLSNSINRQLSNISATLTTQITSLVARIDNQNQQAQKIQHQIQKTIIPAIQEVAKMVDILSQHKHLNRTQQSHQRDTTTSCSEKIQFLLVDHHEHNFNTPKSKKRSQRNNPTQIQTNVLS